MFRTELKNWTKGASSPVSEADIAVNDLLRDAAARGDAGLWLAVGRKRRRRDAARQAVGLDRRSDRRHPRLSCRPRRLVCQRGAGRGRPPGAGGGVRAGQRRVLLCRARARAPRCNGMRRSARRRAPRWIFRASPARSRWSSGSAIAGRDHRFIREIGSLALRLCRVARGRLDAAFAGGQSRDWDLAAANLIVQEADGKMTALSGDTILL